MTKFDPSPQKGITNQPAEVLENLQDRGRTRALNIQLETRYQVLIRGLKNFSSSGITPANLLAQAEIFEKFGRQAQADNIELLPMLQLFPAY